MSGQKGRAMGREESEVEHWTNESRAKYADYLGRRGQQGATIEKIRRGVRKT